MVGGVFGKSTGLGICIVWYSIVLFLSFLPGAGVVGELLGL